MTPQLIDSGYYTPTLTNTANLDASTSSEFMWYRMGDKVHVAGRVDVDPTAAGPTLTELTLTVPLPSLFTGGNDCAGVIAAAISPAEVGFVIAVGATQTVLARFFAQTTADHPMRLEFTYRLRNV